ncbi:hypothetical protein BDP67DRAFT_532235 [Colletotrichum lupini]|nr:hypothetical protein BDP67DRAFT_532235 [Colletotrichum lupini]
MEAHPILQRSLSCEAAFDQLVLSLGSASAPEWVEDCQANFNIWAASIKAKSSGKSSLDHRVKDRKDVSRVICNHLDGLLGALERILEISSLGFVETETQKLPVCRQEDSTIRGASRSESSMSESITDSDSAEEDSLETLYEEQKTYLHKILEKLARLSTAIRKSGTKYRYAKIDAQLNEKDFEDFRTYQIALLEIANGRQRQPKLCTSTEWMEWMESISSEASQSPGHLISPMQQRLVQANILRRHRMQYANRNNTRTAPASAVKKPQEALGMDKQELDKETVYQSHTVVSTSKKLSIEPDNALTLGSELVDRVKSAKTESAGPTATKLGSDFDVQKVVTRKAVSTTTRATHTGINQEYPRCPKVAAGQMFSCPYCADLLSSDYAKTEPKWKSKWSHHIAHDVLPYTCTIEDCASWDEMFVTSSDLIEHIRQRHGEPSWICEFCIPLLPYSECIFGSVSEWEAHMGEAHSSALLSSQLPMLAEMSKTTRLPLMPCPICGFVDDNQPKDQISEHFLQHLHEFALLSLPWPTIDDGENTSVNSDVVPQMDERQAESVASEMSGSESPNTPNKLSNPEYRKHLQSQLKKLEALIMDVKSREGQNESQIHSTAASREHWRDAEKMVVVIIVMLDQLPGKYHSLSAEVCDRWESSLPKLEQILSWVLVEDRDKLDEYAHFIGQNLEEVIYFLREEEFSSIDEIPSPIEKWLQQFEVVNQQLGPAEDHNRVKVAILDTGCNLKNPVLQDSIGLHRVLGWSDSLIESAGMVDEDPGQRGTLLAAMLLRLLPEAWIFIVRVAKYSQDLPQARIHTAEAIKYVAENWTVDIFVMAFGFEGPGESVESAIYEAERLKQDKVLFFAAANNNKTTVHELLPSRYNSVISVHGALHDGTFIPACNPQRHGKGLLRNIYSTLGQEVRFGPGQPTLWGCSLATTIMAAIAACTLQFMLQHEEFLGHLHTIMGTRDWILSLFDIMTRSQDERRERLRFVEPCQLFKDGDEGLENAFALVHQSLRSCYDRIPQSETQYFQRSSYFFEDTWVRPSHDIALGDIILHPLDPSTNIGQLGTHIKRTMASETPDFQHSLGVVKQPLIQDYTRVLQNLLVTSKSVNHDEFLLTAESIQTLHFDPRRLIKDMVKWAADQARPQARDTMFESVLKKPRFIVSGLKIAKNLTLSRKADGPDNGDKKSSKDGHAPQFQSANDLGDDKYSFCQICHHVWLQDGLSCTLCGCDATDIILPENDPRMLSRISLASILKPASSVKLESNARKFQPGHRPQLDRPVSYGDVVIAYSLRKIITRKVDDRIVYDHEHFPPDNSLNLSEWEWKI